MAVTLTPDSSNPVGLLDSVFGTANSALDVWDRWTSKKVENVTKKAEINSPVIENAPGAPAPAISRNTLLLIIGGILAAQLFIRSGKE